LKPEFFINFFNKRLSPDGNTLSSFTFFLTPTGDKIFFNPFFVS